MKNIIVRVLAVIVLAALLTAMGSAFAETWVVATDPVYVHSSCSASEESRVGGLQPGERVIYLGETKTFDPRNTPYPWYKVLYNGRTCWISGKHSYLMDDYGYGTRY